MFDIFIGNGHLDETTINKQSRIGIAYLKFSRQISIKNKMWYSLNAVIITDKTHTPIET